MEKADIIIKDHKKKSDQLRILKRTIKNRKNTTLPVDTLKSMLIREEINSINPLDYAMWDEEEKFSRDEQRKEARMELLKELIELVEG